MRKLQHQVRLQGQDNARVDPALVAEQAAQVSTLWRSIFGRVRCLVTTMSFLKLFVVAFCW
jgi:hypothetical protein